MTISNDSKLSYEKTKRTKSSTTIYNTKENRKERAAACFEKVWTDHSGIMNANFGVWRSIINTNIIDSFNLPFFWGNDWFWRYKACCICPLLKQDIVDNVFKMININIGCQAKTERGI